MEQRDNVARIVAHSPKWAEQYNKYGEEVFKILNGHFVVRIEHIGATAIDGAFARPIITLLVGIENPMDIISVRDFLGSKGYKYAANISTITDIAMAKFDKRTDEMIYDLHIVKMGSREWDKYIAFRNILSKDPELLRQYNQIRVVNFSRNLGQYTKIKNDFIERVLTK